MGGNLQMEDIIYLVNSASFWGIVVTLALHYALRDVRWLIGTLICLILCAGTQIVMNNIYYDDDEDDE